MINDVQNRIIKLRNELKAQKVATELAYSSVLWPDNTPEVTWSGAIAINLSGNVLARFRVRFRRTDGNTGAPFVDFAQNVSFSPTYLQYCNSMGWTISGNDVNYVDDQNYTGYIAGAGTDYVDYYIDFLRDMAANYNTLSSVNVTIVAQAICLTEGALTITRLI